MKNLKGRLHYLGWFHQPWQLITDEGETDLWPIIESFLTSLAGELANQEQDLASYKLYADPESDEKFTYDPGELVLLENISGPGFRNVHAYLDDALCRFNGRMIEIEINETEKSLKLAPDLSEQVFGVSFTEDGNSCRVSPGSEVDICKIGQGEKTCIFSTLGTDGFLCEKFNGGTARLLLDRLANDQINAQRIGNCGLLGREEKSSPVANSAP